MSIPVEYERWRIGNHDQFVRFNRKNLANILMYVTLLEGNILDTYYSKNAFPDDKMQYWLFYALIELPVGKKDEFEKSTGLLLSKPPRITGQDATESNEGTF